MISETIYTLCRSPTTVSSELAKNPTEPPGKIAARLYGEPLVADGSRGNRREPLDDVNEEDLSRAFGCGKWGGTRPSELFLKIYHNVLGPLDTDPLAGMVSPPLMGSCGVIPLSIISTTQDIVRHMANLIVRAQRDVYLATNFWAASDTSTLITNALRELSRRAGERGEKMVVKVIYDRGSPRQVFENHLSVPVKEYTDKPVQLPAPSEIPNIDMQVLNYHRPILGTFHSKFVIVDRKIAVLCSCNIQETDNVEMMTHLEGAIVESFYDMALITWNNALEPPLPTSYDTPAVAADVDVGGLQAVQEGTHPGEMDRTVDGEEDAYAYGDRERYDNDVSREYLEEEVGNNGGNGDCGGQERFGDGVNDGGFAYDSRIHQEAGFNGDSRNSTRMSKQAGGTAINDGHVHFGTPQNATAVAYDTPSIDGPEESSTLGVNSGVDGSIIRSGGSTASPLTNASVLPSSEYNTHSSGPSGDTTDSGERLPELTTKDEHYDVDIAAEVSRVQSVVSPGRGESRMEAVTRHLNTTFQPDTKGNAPECAPHEEMTPYIPHPVHEPFPIAMVCRKPYGAIANSSVYNPQNEAWLAGLKYATESVFIQTPNLNAAPVVAAVLDAVKRGVKVICYLCIGYNDSGELLPGQGGTNEMVVHKLYKDLENPEHRNNLEVYWYTAKDQTRPINAKYKKRSCHNNHLGIQGNGNQDTQSWFHSQEINILVDSRMICTAWIDALRKNQNTHLYGQVSDVDGVWMSEDDGKGVEGSVGIDPGRWSWAKGFVGAVQRVRGAKDF